MNIQYSNMGFLSTKQTKDSYYANVIWNPIGMQNPVLKKSRARRLYNFVVAHGISCALINILRKATKKIIRYKSKEELLLENRDSDMFDFPSIKK